MKQKKNPQIYKIRKNANKVQKSSRKTRQKTAKKKNKKGEQTPRRQITTTKPTTKPTTKKKKRAHMTPKPGPTKYNTPSSGQKNKTATNPTKKKKKGKSTTNKKQVNKNNNNEGNKTPRRQTAENPTKKKRKRDEAGSINNIKDDETRNMFQDATAFLISRPEIIGKLEEAMDIKPKPGEASINPERLETIRQAMLKNDEMIPRITKTLNTLEPNELNLLAVALNLEIHKTTTTEEVAKSLISDDDAAMFGAMIGFIPSILWLVVSLIKSVDNGTIMTHWQRIIAQFVVVGGFLTMLSTLMTWLGNYLANSTYMQQ